MVLKGYGGVCVVCVCVRATVVGPSIWIQIWLVG